MNEECLWVCLSFSATTPQPGDVSLSLLLPHPWPCHLSPALGQPPSPVPGFQLYPPESISLGSHGTIDLNMSRLKG